MGKTKTHKLKVTQEIINLAVPCDASRCMVAMAVREQIPGAWSVNVDDRDVKFNLGGDEYGGEATRYCYPVPAVASEKIEQFDVDRAAVQPFEFQLDGRQAFTKPVVRRGKSDKITPQNPPHKRKPCKRWCKHRRFHGKKATTTN